MQAAYNNTGSSEAETRGRSCMGNRRDESMKMFTDPEDASQPHFIPTGLAELDEALWGGLARGLNVIGGISSVGKTTFAMQIADHIAASGTAISQKPAKRPTRQRGRKKQKQETAAGIRRCPRMP